MSNGITSDRPRGVLRFNNTLIDLADVCEASLVPMVNASGVPVLICLLVYKGGAVRAFEPNPALDPVALHAAIFEKFGQKPLPPPMIAAPNPKPLGQDPLSQVIRPVIQGVATNP